MAAAACVTSPLLTLTQAAPPTRVASQVDSSRVFASRSSLALPIVPDRVDREGQRRTDVAVGDGAAALCEQVGLAQRAHPVGEVLAAHHLACGLDLRVAGGRDLHGHHLIVAQVDALAAVGDAERLQHGVVRRAGRRVRAPGRRQAVDHQLQARADLLQMGERLLFHLAAEGVAVDHRHVAPGGARPLLQGGQVVPTGRRGLVPLRGPLQANGGPARAVPKNRAGQAGQPVPGAGPDDQRVSDPAARRAGLRSGDLGVDVGRAPRGVRVQRDEAANPGGNDLAGHRAFLPEPPQGRQVEADPARPPQPGSPSG